MIVLVCGGRDYRDDILMVKTLDKINHGWPITKLIHGGANGADELAGVWAKSKAIRVQEFRANWTRYGKAAGPMRNQRMIDEGQPKMVVAFPGGSGTADMISRAEKAGVPVVRIEP